VPQDTPPVDDFETGLLYGVTRRQALRGSLVAASALGLLGLDACGGDDDSSTSAPAGLTKAKIRNASGTINVLGYQFEQVDKQQNAGAVKAKWAYVPSNVSVLAKLKQPRSFDVALIDPDITQAAYESGRYQPIQTDLLTNYSSLDPAFRDIPYLKHEGKTYGIPFNASWSLLGWDSNSVPEPNTIEDLLDPVYKGRIGLLDSEDNPLLCTALALGLTEKPQEATQEDLAKAVEFLKKLKPNVRTFFNFGDEPNLFGNGEVSVVFPSFGSVLLGASKGKAKVKGKFMGSVTYVDTWGITSDANVPAAMQWIDRFISPEGQRAVAQASYAVPANGDATDALPKPLQYPSSELFAKAPIVGPIATSPGGEYVSYPELADAWREVKG
jgi:spermidine/putrescine-binding protein